MEKSKKRNRIIILIAFLVVALAVVAGVILWIIRHTYADKPLQNIYFTEYENEKDKNDTIIYKYDQENDELVEIGSVPGNLYHCTINKEETLITGFLEEESAEGIPTLIQYDIETGMAQTTDVMEKLQELPEDVRLWSATLYDGGNKIFINYTDENENKCTLTYDIVTGEREEILVNLEKVRVYLAINKQGLWYMRDDAIYKYEWETQTETKIADAPPDSDLLAPSTGLIAYVTHSQKKIYAYNISSGKSKCIVPHMWNTYYTSFGSALWTNDGRQLCYYKDFPGFSPLYSDTSLMVYDVKNGKSHCIYKVKSTMHTFQYIKSN